MLNPALNPAALAADYVRKRRLLVRDILAADTAATLAHCLREAVPWGIATLVEGQGRCFQAQELQHMPRGEWQALVNQVQADALSGYQFFYNSYQMVTAWKEKRDPELFLHRFLQFLNSPPMLDFARRVTGHTDIAKADAQATRYLPGHFLRRHNDVFQASERDSRRAAYVLNLTRNWQADWGGQLQFLDESGGVEESWLPGYNTLVLFNVPAWHCVSCVAPYAGEPRLAITGWFRTH